MKISVFGLGYVGCVSAGCLAQSGHNVIGVDINAQRVALMNAGRATVIEKDIDAIIERGFVQGRICATSDPIAAVVGTDVSIISVGTPSTNQGRLDLEHVYQTASQIGIGLRKKDSFHTVIIRSTVMPGTNKRVGELISEASGKRRGKDFSVVSNPEFLREGSAVEDYYNPAYTVFGGDNDKAIGVAKEVYSRVDAPIEVVSIEVAEMIKYVNNSFHALKVTFANEIGNICRAMEIDSHLVMNLFVKDTKLNISPRYFMPGFAYGGSCLPKDLKGLRAIARDHYLSTPVLDSIEESNELQKQIVLEKIQEVGKKRIGILGLSFKSGTDDLRYSPAVDVTERLIGKGYTVLIYDKDVRYSNLTGRNREYVQNHLPHIERLISQDLDEVLEGSDVLVVTHKLPEFEGLLIAAKDKVIIDLARIDHEISHNGYVGICW